MSGLGGKIAAGVSIAIVGALGLAVAFAVLVPSTFQSGTSVSVGGSSSSSATFPSVTYNNVNSSNSYITTSSVVIIYKLNSSSTYSANTTATTISPTSFAYLTVADNATCMAGGQLAPCWGSNNPYTFDCLSAAATPQGCTQQVTNPLANQSYVITVFYPFSNQTEPLWANCWWTVQGEIGEQGYAYCNPVNSTSFIIGIPAPPPT